LDPALRPLPTGDDRDLTNPLTIAHARGLKPAEKVAGRRKKARAASKGKRKAHSVSSSDSEDSESSESEGKVEVTSKGRGRPAGAGNYTKSDVGKLLDLIEKAKPAGAKGWGRVAKRYNKWAAKFRRPQREPKALENKYKTLLRTKKPTGDAECPPEIKRAHQIEQLINDKVGTRGLSDDSLSENDGASDVQIVEPVRTAVARRAASPPLRSRRTTGADLLTTFNRAFDPITQQAREDARSQRSFETAQLLAATQQLDVLRVENSALKDQINDLKRALDRGEFQLQLTRVTGGSLDNKRGRPHRRRSYRNDTRDYSGLQRVQGKIRCEKRYPDGGAMTYWVTDASSDASD
ncbi:hypothetical protein GGX14DRAFT_332240, partial [Mycena pura]